MTKEVSDKVIVIFIIIAVVVSVLGTFIVYTQSNIKYTSQVSLGKPASVGFVGIVVLPSNNDNNGGRP